MTDMEMLKVPADMEEEILRSNGFIAESAAGTDTIDMIGRKRAEAGTKERNRDSSEGRMTACPGTELEGYGDLFLYVPEERQVIRIAEGDGDSLLEEDIEGGCVDYIYYDQHGLEAGMPVMDGGMVLLEEQLREKYQSMAGCIPDVLDMAYGTSQMGYMIL